MQIAVIVLHVELERYAPLAQVRHALGGKFAQVLRQHGRRADYPARHGHDTITQQLDERAEAASCLPETPPSHRSPVQAAADQQTRLPARLSR